VHSNEQLCVEAHRNMLSTYV